MYNLETLKRRIKKIGLVETKIFLNSPMPETLRQTLAEIGVYLANGEVNTSLLEDLAKYDVSY